VTFVLLDNSLEPNGPSYLFANHREIIMAAAPEEVAPALARLESALAAGHHAAGYFAYELGLLLEPRLAHLLPVERAVPLLWFVVVDRREELTSGETAAWLDAHSGPYERPSFGAVSLDEASYLARFATVERMIAQGDIYQLNLTFRTRFQLEGSPIGLYRDLRRKQRVAFGAIIAAEQFTVVSSSPELFVRIGDGVIETRPMKGTAARAPTLLADAAVRAELAADIKQRAENLMIVDLMRNDIGRIAEIGSVEVTDLFSVETYRTLHQLTSGIRATLKPGVGLADWLGATFSPGSVTGAPKVRAMELIAALETEPRGVYCGAIGWLAPGGDACFNVAIRTVTVWPGGRAEMGIGSGLVADSVGTSEYAECLLKMKFLTDPPIALELFETMLWERVGGVYLLERHLARLAGSAAYFNIAYRRDDALQAIERATREAGPTRLRVRLVLGEDGTFDATAVALPPPASEQTVGYVVSAHRLDPRDPLLYHKTTQRTLYDGEYQRAHEMLGAGEVIFLNTRGEVTEGSRTNLFLERDGILLTPALSCGLLPGTLRAELLATGRAREAVLTLDDLATGTVYLGNSVRGLQRAEPIGKT
jgi:para-aminobenzoate synthetase/4-amino-4-deoxychorismate lyase